MNTKRNTRFRVWPVMRRLYPLEKPGRKVKAAVRSRSFAAGGSTRSNRHTLIALYLIALLLALNLILRFPDLGALIAQYNQF